MKLLQDINEYFKVLDQYLELMYNIDEYFKVLD